MADISKIKPNGASGTEYNLKDATARAAMIPSGGTQGQVLVKKTGTDYDTEWSNGGGGTTVVANPSGTATDDLTKVQIGSTIYDVTDKDAMRGVSIKVSSSTLSERYYLIWEHVGAPQGYISPLQISGDIGGWTGGTKFDVSCVFNNTNNIPKIYGFKESDTSANLIITRTSTDSSDNNTHDRLYIYFPTGLYYAEANLNIIPPESNFGQGTFYTNPTLTTTYEGTLATSLAACPVTNKLAGLSDVKISNPQNGQILQYDSASGKWLNHISTPAPPEGTTVTPTDDIQTWLNCANIWDKNYTTINQVLGDSTTLLVLISNNNAVNYMVRSTTWATDVCANSMAMTDIGSNNYCADALLDDSTWLNAICNSAYFERVLNVKVPTMTDDTTPSGEASSYDNTTIAWKAFDNDGNTHVNIKQDSPTNSSNYLRYKFANPVCVNKIYLQPYAVQLVNNATMKIQGSADGSNWTDLYTESNYNSSEKSYIIQNTTKYLYIQIWFSGGISRYNVGGTYYYYTRIYGAQFYGRA